MKASPARAADHRGGFFLDRVLSRLFAAAALFFNASTASASGTKTEEQMDKRTSQRMARLASRAVRDGVATTTEVKRLAGCVLSQVPSVRAHARKATARKKRR